MAYDLHREIGSFWYGYKGKLIVMKPIMRAKLTANSLALDMLGSVHYSKLKYLRHSATRFLPAFHSGKYIFVHIPKTGGTSISKLLTSDYQATHAHYMLDDYYAENYAASEAYFKFCVVRNPWDRLVSAYHHLHDLPEWVGVQTKQFVQTAGLAHTTFDDLVARLTNERWLRVWPHFREQWCYVRHDTCNGMDQILRFEQLTHDMALIAEHLGLTNAAMSEENVSRRERDYHTYYNAETAALVANLYERDISEFKYEF